MCTVCCLIVNPLAPQLIPGVIRRTHKFKLQDLIFSCKLFHTHKVNIYLILDTNMRYIEMSEYFARLYVLYFILCDDFNLYFGTNNAANILLKIGAPCMCITCEYHVQCR